MLKSVVTLSSGQQQQWTYNRNTAHVEYKIKSDTNWNHLQIIQKIPQQHTGKAGNQGTAESSQIGLCTSTAESTNVKVENIHLGKQHYMYHKL